MEAFYCPKCVRKRAKAEKRKRREAARSLAQAPEDQGGDNLPENSSGQQRRSGQRTDFSEVDTELEKRQIDQAHKILKYIMKLENSSVFCEPVPPEVPDYYKIVEKPMDLGTIQKWIKEGDHYHSAFQILKDVRLTWRNCRTYNMQGSEICKAADKLETAFESRWAEAGLPRDESVSYSEADRRKCGKSLSGATSLSAQIPKLKSETEFKGLPQEVADRTMSPVACQRSQSPKKRERRKKRPRTDAEEAIPNTTHTAETSVEGASSKIKQTLKLHTRCQPILECAGHQLSEEVHASFKSRVGAALQVDQDSEAHCNDRERVAGNGSEIIRGGDDNQEADVPCVTAEPQHSLGKGEERKSGSAQHKGRRRLGKSPVNPDDSADVQRSNGGNEQSARTSDIGKPASGGLKVTIRVPGAHDETNLRRKTRSQRC
uniref:Tripartite motif-containing protein 33 n=1 Tax=Tetraselmis sp. GSL018 TaxID=582737 RepID=A0A061SHW1_9CHLO